MKESTMLTLIVSKHGWTQRSGKLIHEHKTELNYLIQMALSPPNTIQILLTLFLQVTHVNTVKWLIWLIPQRSVSRYSHIWKYDRLCRTQKSITCMHVFLCVHLCLFCVCKFQSGILEITSSAFNNKPTI